MSSWCGPNCDVPYSPESGHPTQTLIRSFNECRIVVTRT